MSQAVRQRDRNSGEVLANGHRAVALRADTDCAVCADSCGAWSPQAAVDVKSFQLFIVPGIPLVHVRFDLESLVLAVRQWSKDQPSEDTGHAARKLAHLAASNLGSHASRGHKR